MRLSEIANPNDAPPKKFRDLFEYEKSQHRKVADFIEGDTLDLTGSLPYLQNNGLKCLVGCPDELIMMELVATELALESMEGCPQKIMSAIDVGDNELESLEGICPVLNGLLNVNWNRLKNLDHMPKRLISLNLMLNELPHLFSEFDRLTKAHVFDHLGYLVLDQKQITHAITDDHGILTLFKMPNLTRVKIGSMRIGDAVKVMNIVNTYLDLDGRTSKDILACQNELLDNGFEEYARL